MLVSRSMNIRLQFLAVIALLCTSTFSFGVQWDGDLFITGGYRSDCLETSVKAFDLNDDFFIKDAIKGKSIDVYQIGIKGKALICNQFFFRGHANVGRVYDGKYTDQESLKDGQGGELDAKIYKGHTYDTSIGGGYLYPFSCCFSIGPTAGYSYNDEKITMHKAVVDDESFPVFDGLVYKMSWQGPWLGIDSIFTMRCFDVHIGYEYHWCNWNAEWLLDGPDSPESGFSDVRKSNDAYGNVFFIDFVYSFLQCWDVGLGFKYQNWNVDNGKLVPKNGTFAELDDGISRAKVTNADLTSYGIQLSIGRHF
jgi:Protochlamydia outer membrane protein